mmetsp:Transcript_4083/g.14362  ORF Transcript_4083/g.14362 Transcript_4083/m.14362 type:complete len:319 (+) Transcript_4083:1241-2197(+)
MTFLVSKSSPFSSSSQSSCKYGNNPCFAATFDAFSSDLSFNQNLAASFHISRRSEIVAWRSNSRISCKCCNSGINSPGSMAWEFMATRCATAKSPVDNAASNNSRSLVRKSKCFNMRAAETVCFVNCAPINSVSSASEESEFMTSFAAATEDAETFFVLIALFEASLISNARTSATISSASAKSLRLAALMDSTSLFSFLLLSAWVSKNEPVPQAYEVNIASDHRDVPSPAFMYKFEIDVRIASHVLRIFCTPRSSNICFRSGHSAYALAQSLRMYPPSSANASPTRNASNSSITCSGVSNPRTKSSAFGCSMDDGKS